MNDICKRNCTWNYNNSCCPECPDHFRDGTAYTKNCSEYLNEKFMENFCDCIDECQILLGDMTYNQSRRARYELRKIYKGEEDAVK